MAFRCLLLFLWIISAADVFSEEVAQKPLAKPKTRSIAVDQKPRRITLDLHDVPASEIFDQLARQSSIPIEISQSGFAMPRPLPTYFPETVYSIQLQSDGFWPALMRACDATHMHVAGSGTGDRDAESMHDAAAVVLWPSAFGSDAGWAGRPVSIAESGVVVASVIARQSSVEFSDPNPSETGYCNIELSAFVDPMRFPAPMLPPKVSEAVDEEGRQLVLSYDTAASAPQRSPDPIGRLPTPYLWSCPIRIAQPALHKRVATLKGSITFAAANSRTEIEVDDLVHVGTWQTTAEEFQVEFSDIRASGDGSILVTLKRRQCEDAQWNAIVGQFKSRLRSIQILDASDRRMDVSYTQREERSDQVSYSAKVSRGRPTPGSSFPPAATPLGPPMKLRWSCVESETKFELPFEFHNLETP
jgi:hypothetical protein